MKTIIEQALLCASSDLVTMPVEGLASSNYHSHKHCGEYLTLALKQPFPSRFLYAMYIAEELERVFPEIHKMTKMSQPVRWHPEGNVFNHTMQVMDAIEQHAHPEWKSSERWGKLTAAAMFHDIGKILSKRPPTHSNHEKKGVEEYEKFASKYGLPEEWSADVKYVIEYHGHVHKSRELKPVTVKRVFDAAPSEDARLMLLNVAVADSIGRSHFNRTIRPSHVDVMDKYFDVLSENNSDLKTLKNFMAAVQ